MKANRAFVLNHDKTPLMPCVVGRAYQLLNAKRAAIYRHVPFTIILKEQTINPGLQDVELKIDPGSKTSGIVLIANQRVVFAANLTHRGSLIRKAMKQRAGYRRRRRSVNLRYRPARFDHRTRCDGWLAPSLQSRVDNVQSWARKLKIYAPLASIAVETTRFDTQKMQDPNIAGIQYQQGALLGYEVREYLLEKFNRTCVYCDKTGVPLQIEHVQPKSKRGSDRISNLALACDNCNKKKADRPIEEFLAKDSMRLAKILAQLKTPLRDAAMMNATRYAIGRTLQSFSLPVSFWSGGRTKFNRSTQNYPKDHWIDAACVGETGEHIRLNPTMQILSLRATGRGTRQVRRTDAYGFPRGVAKTAKRRNGFSTGDMVVATIARGKAPGRHIGRISATNAKRFDVATPFGKIGTTYRYLRLLQRDYGYAVT